MTHDLRDALRAEYELAHDAIRPDGVAAVRATASRQRRRQALAGAAALAVALSGGVAAWRLAPGDDPPQVVADSCGRPGVDVAVFLRMNITDEQAIELDRTLRNSPEVYCLVFETKDEAWEHFKRAFSDAPDLVAATKPDQILENYRFRVAKAAESDVIEQRIRAIGEIVEYLCSCPTAKPR
ncbi:permease-like cell division protein FtsX [Dactylosporangium sp. NPDC049525]|uniref:permease-like cell division protein FtsX n=1 Tax=Dactylosporangium sp. NPDC049525 TaxID=3154730 RepID=UPI003439C429